MPYETFTLVCAAITAAGTPISIWLGFISRRSNQIQQEQTGEYREQTEIMRAEAMGATVPVRIHSLPPATVQLSWLRRQGALPYLILAVIFAIASASLFYAYSQASVQVRLQKEIARLHGELNELKANQWPTLTEDTISRISKILGAAGSHQYDLDSCASPDCIYFANGLRTAFAQAGWLPIAPPPVRPWSIPPPPGWAINGNDDDLGMKALHDAIQQNLHVEIPTGRFGAPEGMHYLSIRIGRKPFGVQLTQDGNGNSN